MNQYLANILWCLDSIAYARGSYFDGQDGRQNMPRAINPANIQESTGDEVFVKASERKNPQKKTPLTSTLDAITENCRFTRQKGESPQVLVGEPYTNEKWIQHNGDRRKKNS